MSKENDTIQVFIPIAFKRKNGRPKILAPDVDPHFQARVQSPHILRALGRAWSWRRKLETGEAATIQDIARAEKVSTQFVGPIMRLAYLSPDVLERLLLWREAPSATLLQMVEATYLPWAEQVERVFDGGMSPKRARIGKNDAQSSEVQNMLETREGDQVSTSATFQTGHYLGGEVHGPALGTSLK